MRTGGPHREYRLRIAQLTAEIPPRPRGDGPRLRGEYDWLIDELSAVTGIGGHVRTFADHGERGERARIAVGKTIRRALAAIAALDPELGEHLRDNVHTGTRCCYWPPPDPSDQGLKFSGHPSSLADAVARLDGGGGPGVCPGALPD